MTSRNSTFLTGYRSIEETLKGRVPGGVLFVARETGRVLGFVHAAEAGGVPIRRVSSHELGKLAGALARDCALRVSSAPIRNRTVATIVAPPARASSLVLLLDHITDPHNFGAILRSADQFGADGVITTERRSADVTAVVMQSSAGAAAHVPVARVKNLSAAIEELKKSDYWVFGADMSGERADRTRLEGRVAIILGAEGAGLSRLARERSDGLIAVRASGHADSLNVSVAAGILLYEIRRQQGWFDTI